MNLQEKTSEAWKRWSPELLIFALLLGFGFWINRGVELKGLYMDDLYLWSCYGDQSFTEYVFPMAAAGSASCFTWHPGWNFSLLGDMWNGWFRSTSS